jgi:Putative MetA-pathway of phenol degradation
VSLQVSAPLGQYDNSKLLNIGNNRWSFRPELGISKAWGPWTFEVAPSVTIFSDNTDFFGGNVFAQAPIYAVQAHLLYTFPEDCSRWRGVTSAVGRSGRVGRRSARGTFAQGYHSRFRSRVGGIAEKRPPSMLLEHQSIRMFSRGRNASDAAADGH